MTESYEAEIEVRGETVPVTFEEPGVITRMNLVSKMPENLSNLAEDCETVEEAEEQGIGVDALEMEDLEWMQDVIKEVTDIPEDTVEALPMETFTNMMNPAAKMIADDRPDEVQIDQPESAEHTVAEVRERI